MNLIGCDQNCRHQKDGYCTLNQIAQLTGNTSAGCGYYEGSTTPPLGDAQTEVREAPPSAEN